MSKAEIQAQFGDECLDFLELLTLKFSDKINDLLEARKTANVKGFLPETKKIRNSNWTVASPPKQIQDRRVEITGPVSRKSKTNSRSPSRNHRSSI
jgi:malate synthase